MIRNYIEWMLSLPWTKENFENNNIDDIRAKLDARHYGLKEVKERIL